MSAVTLGGPGTVMLIMRLRGIHAAPTKQLQMGLVNRAGNPVSAQHLHAQSMLGEDLQWLPCFLPSTSSSAHARIA